MLIVLYNIFLFMSIVFALPLMLVKVLSAEDKQKTIVQRLRTQVLTTPLGSRPIWIHALSVGEVLASAPLVKKIRKIQTNRPVVLSVSTITGYQIAKKLLAGDVEGIFFFPYDFIWPVKKVIRSVAPAIFILVETDIWPNFIYEMKRRGIPFILVNGRVSPRSFSGYRCLSFFMSRVFSNISSICTQTEMDAKRFVAIGAVPERVHVTGNIKFDQALLSSSDKVNRSLRLAMGIEPRAKVFLAGSTHEGEEVILSHCLGVLKKSFRDLVLVVVPRDPGRANEVQRMFNRAGFRAALLTGLDNPHLSSMPEVIVVDTIGDLRQLYAVADVVFVGKSLVNLGGQNPLEPAAVKKPILFGPHMFNFKAIAEHLIREGGALQVANEEELVAQASTLLPDVERSKEMGMRAYEVFHMNRGAVDKTIGVIERFL